jgi:putative transposase
MAYDYHKLTPQERQELVEERRRRGFPAHRPPHLALDRACYLFTAACYQHQYYLHTAARRQQILDQLFEQFICHGMSIAAWVVLTNHYHLLIHVPGYEAVPDIFKQVHGRSSYEWNRQDHTLGRKVWYRYSDRLIRSERHYYTTLSYIHYNPVKHNLVKSPYDWSCSSVHWYLEEYGREWLQSLWQCYPVRDYGKKWDDF